MSSDLKKMPSLDELLKNINNIRKYYQINNNYHAEYNIRCRLVETQFFSTEGSFPLKHLYNKWGNIINLYLRHQTLINLHCIRHEQKFNIFFVKRAKHGGGGEIF